LKITICIGSSCHLKGSRQVIEQLKSLVDEYDLQVKIELCGAFCMGECLRAVCVKVDDKIYSLKPENTRSFFEKKILAKLRD